MKLTLCIGAGLLGLNTLLSLAFSYLHGTPGPDANIEPTILAVGLLATAVSIGALAYGYTLLRKVVRQEKARWYMIAISTIVMILTGPLSAFIRNSIGRSAHTEGTLITPIFHPLALIFVAITSFVVSFIYVFIIAKIYERRFGFEIE